jgi:hypothetical protein
MTKRIQLSSATRKGIALGIGALCACAVGVLLAVGTGGAAAGPQASVRADASPVGAFRERSSESGDALAELRACLQEHDVTLPERGQRPMEATDRLRAALEARRQYLPRPPFGDGDRGLGPAQGTAPPPSDGRDDDLGAEGTF